MGLLLQSRWRICVVGVATPGFITLAYASYLSRTVRPVHVGQIHFEREHVAYQTRTRGACVRVFQSRCKASDACLARGSWISCGHLRIEQSGTIDGHSGLNMSSSEPTMGNLRRGRCRARSRATLTTTRGIRRLTICISGSCARDRSAVVYEPRVVSGATSSMTMPSVQRLSSNSRLSQTNFGRSRWPTSVCALQVAVDVRRCHASR
jgi:hypothetical protein